jgi:hypothetical protein
VWGVGRDFTLKNHYSGNLTGCCNRQVLAFYLGFAVYGDGRLLIQDKVL